MYQDPINRGTTKSCKATKSLPKGLLGVPKGLLGVPGYLIATLSTIQISEISSRIQ